MEHLKYIQFCIPSGSEEKARSLLAELGASVPESFGYAGSSLLKTSHAILLPEKDVAGPFVERLAAEGIDDSPFIRSERRYSNAELDQAGLFWIHVLKQKGDGYTTYGTVFDTTRVCPQCGSGAVQKGQLVVDCSRFRGTHFAATFNFEIILSAPLAAAIAGLSGFALSHVIDCKSRKESETFFQLRPSSSLPALIPPTRFIESSMFCSSCRRNGVFLDSEMHIETSPGEDDVYHTREMFGEMRARSCAGPETVLSAEFVRRVREFDAKALAVEPLFLGGSAYSHSRHLYV